MTHIGDDVREDVVENSTAASSASDPWTRLKHATTA